MVPGPEAGPTGVAPLTPSPVQAELLLYVTQAFGCRMRWPRLLPSSPGAPPAQPAGHQVSRALSGRPVWLDLTASRAGAPAAASGPGPALSSVLGGGDRRDH